VANSASKASLRVALDEIFETHIADQNFHYFPSYELVTAWLNNPYDEDNRHVTQETINNIMGVFSENYCIQNMD
jgi:hypothetical protein